MSESSDITRKNFAEGDAARDAGLTTPEDVIRFDDLAYGPVPKWNLLDIYRPKAAGEKGKLQKLPVILNCHGGGWVYGDKEVYQFYGMSMAQRGFAFVNINYRLAPETPFPGMLEDFDLACSFVAEHAEAYGLDTEHVFLVGDSAGGHLGALYAQLLVDQEYQRRLRDTWGLSIRGALSLKAVALNCGVYDLEQDVIHSHGISNTANLLADALTPERDTEEMRALLSPNRHITPAFPPAYVMTAVKDFLRYQEPFMTDALKARGVPVEHKTYGVEGQDLLHVFHCDMHSEDGRLCNDEEAAFFRKFL